MVAIKDWFIDPNANLPTGNTVIGTTLDDELREIKAVIRQESLNKQWERWGLTCTYLTNLSFKIKQPSSTVSWGPTGNGPAYIGRKVRITHNDSNHPGFVGTIETVTPNVAGVNGDPQYYTVVEVTPEYSGTLFSDIAEVQFGAITPNSNTLPATVRLTTRNPFFSDNITILGESTATNWNIDATFPELPMAPGARDPKHGEVYYVQFSWAGIGYAPVTDVNIGSMYVSINGGYVHPVYRLKYTAYAQAYPIPSFVELVAGDIRYRQTVALMMDRSNPTTPRWQMLSPAATVPTLLDIAALFSVKDSTVNTTNTTNRDTTNCDHQGYMTIFGNYAIQWALVKQIPVQTGSGPGSRIVTLPVTSAKILAVQVTPVDVATTNPLYIDTLNTSQIKIFSIATTYEPAAYLVVISRLNNV